MICWGGDAKGHKERKGGMREGRNPGEGRWMSSGHVGIRGSILLDSLRNNVEFTSESCSQEMGKLRCLTTDYHPWCVGSCPWGVPSQHLSFIWCHGAGEGSRAGKGPPAGKQGSRDSRLLGGKLPAWKALFTSHRSTQVGAAQTQGKATAVSTAQRSSSHWASFLQTPGGQDVLMGFP